MENSINEKEVRYYDKILDFIKRNVVLTAVAGIALFLLAAGFEETRSLLMIVVTECIAISLSELAVFAYTRINFTKTIIEGDDGKLSDAERHDLLHVIAYIFLGVHILCGLVFFGFYFVQIR